MGAVEFEPRGEDGSRQALARSAGQAWGRHKRCAGAKRDRCRVSAATARISSDECEPSNEGAAASQGVIRLYTAAIFFASGGGRFCAASRVRQSFESSLRADVWPPKGNRCAHGAWGRPRTPGSVVSHGNPLVVVYSGDSCDRGVFLECEGVAH